MTKRYVFWRDSSARPYKKNDGKFAPTAHLERLGQAASVNPDGSISWTLPDFHQTQLPLRSAAVVVGPAGYELNETDAWSIVHSAITKIIKRDGGGKPVLSNDLLATADKLAAQYFRQPPQRFVLVTSLSVDSLPATTIRIRDCEVSALARRGGRYPLPASTSRLPTDEPYSRHLRNTKYLTVRVKTEARSIHEATDTALDALYFLRGLWMLYGTHGQWSISFGSTKQKPLGEIQTGPIHTLHKPNGTLAADTFWYEAYYVGDIKNFKPKRGWKKYEEFRRWATRKIRRLPYAREAEKLIIRYAAALDNTNLDVAFLQMWGLLEKITDTVGSSYDETIERAVWLFKDRKACKEELEHLRLRRNEYVHAAKSGEDRDQIVYLAKSFVDPLLVRLIDNKFKVNSIPEYGKFLSLPTDPNTLKKRRDEYALAMRLRK